MVLRGAWNERRLQDKPALLDDDDNIPPENHAIDRVISDGFRLKESRSAPARHLFLSK